MNILTIDMDFISNNYLENQLASTVGGKITEKFWDIALDSAGVVSKTYSNKNNLMFLLTTFFNAVKGEGTKVVFGLYHDSILNHIPKDSGSLKVLNIDHHHDLFYNEAMEFQSNNGECSEANWMLPIKDRVEEYIWVGNKNSEAFNFPVEKLPFKYTTYSSEEYPTIGKDTHWDYVYVCLSPNYTAEEHWFYFFMLKKLYETVKDIEPLEIDAKRYTPLKEDFDTYCY